MGVIDNWEDGEATSTPSSDWGSWSGDTGSLDAQQTVVLAGDWSGEFTTDGAISLTVSRSGDATAPFSQLFRMDGQNGDGSDRGRFSLYQGGTLILGFEFEHDGDVSVQGTVVNSWSADTTYQVDIIWDFGNDQFDFLLDGVNEGTFSFSNSASGYDKLEVIHDSSSDNNTYNLYLDDIIEGPPPTNVTATTVDGDQIDVTWNDVSGEDGYVVYRAQSSGSTKSDYTQVASLGADTTSYSDTGLEDGEQYYYRVTADYGGTESPLSKEVNAITDLPAASSLTLDTSVEDEITTDWARNDDSSDGTWEIYRSTDGTLGSNIASISNLTTTSYTDTGLNDGEEYHYTVRRSTDHATADSSQQSGVTILPAPSGLSVSGHDTDQIDLTWTDNADNEDGYRILISTDGGSTYSQNGGDLAANTTSGTASGLRNGEEYVLKVRVFTEHTTTDSGTVTQLTDFVTITNLSGDASVEDEITLSWDDTANYGDYQVEHKETSASTWIDDGTVAESTTSKTITGLEDGEKYDFRVRHETEHGSGSYTSIVDTTLLPAPSGLSAAVVSWYDFGTDIDLSWTDNSDHGDETYRVFVRESGGSFSDESGDLGANVTSYTYTPAVDSQLYEFKVRVETEHVQAESSVVSEASPAAKRDGYWFVLKNSEDDYQGFDDILSLGPVRERTGRGDFSMTATIDSRYYNYKFGDIYLMYRGEFIFRGVALDLDEHETGVEFVLGGPGAAGKLEQDEASVTYTNTAVWEALDDYGQNHTNYTWTVYEPTPETVATNDEIQTASSTSDWNDLVTFAADKPLELRNDRIEVLQACWTEEAEDYDSGSIGELDADRFSGGGSADGQGVAVVFDSNNDYLEISWTPEYDVPDADFEIAARLDGNDTGNQGDVEWSLNGTNLGTFNGAFTDVEWRQLTKNGDISDPGGLTAGTQYTLRIEATGSWNGGEFQVDVVAPYDDRYSWTFDNTVTTNASGNNYLDGPEWRPDLVQLTLATAEASYNVTAASATLTASDTSNQFAVEFSNDDGTTYVKDANTDTPSVTFSSTVGTSVTTRLTLGRYGTGTTTPGTGRKGHTVDDWSLKADGDDLAVVDDRTVDLNDWENVQTLAELGGFDIVAEHAVDGISFEAFRAGTRRRYYALELDGAGDYVDLPAGLVDATDNVTVSLWLDPDDATTQQRVLSLRDDIQLAVALSHAGSDGQLDLYINGTWYEDLASISSSATALTISYDESVTRWTVYVDGTAEATVDGEDSTAGNGSSRLGASSSATLEYAGLLDEVRVDSRAWSPAEVSVYAAGRVDGLDVDSDTAMYLRLDDGPGAGGTAADASSNNNDGTIKGDPSWTASVFPDSDRWTTADRRRRENVRGYANRVVVRGAKDGAGGRYTAERKDGAEINDKGQTISAVVKDASVTSREAAVYRALTELTERVGEDAVTGRRTVYPRMVPPGYTYKDAEWGDVELDRTTFQLERGQASGRLVFDLDDRELPQSLASLRRDVEDLK